MTAHSFDFDGTCKCTYKILEFFYHNFTMAKATTLSSFDEVCLAETNCVVLLTPKSRSIILVSERKDSSPLYIGTT